jgi:hypothetical protein
VGAHIHPVEDLDKVFPPWVRPPFKQCLNRLKDETRFMHLAWSGLEKIRGMPELLKALKQPALAEIAKSTITDEAIKSAEADADWVDAEAKQDFPLLHSHCAVSVWSILEVFVEDLAVVWFLNRTESWDLTILEKVRTPIAVYERLQGEDRARHVVSEITRHIGVDLKTGLGHLSAVLTLLDLSPGVGANATKALHELCQVRNAIVHRGARADRRLLDACPYLPWSAGEPIRVSHPLFGWYHAAAQRYAERAMNRVVQRFGSAGCNCAGMDDIGVRPAG